jgi:hypothetical protein
MDETDPDPEPVEEKKKRKLPPKEERVKTAKLAAHASWAKESDPSARTAPARQAADARFEHEVDPDGVLPVAERHRRAQHARKAFYARMALRSAQARRVKTTEARTSE